MEFKNKAKEPQETDRLTALEENMSKMAANLNMLSEFVMKQAQPKQVVNNSVEQLKNAQEEPIEQETAPEEPKPQIEEKPSPAPGYVPGKQVAQKYAPQVTAPPVHNKPRVLGKIDAVQSVGTISGGQMSKTIEMMEKMKDLRMGGQQMTCSDKALFNARVPFNNPKKVRPINDHD